MQAKLSVVYFGVTGSRYMHDIQKAPEKTSGLARLKTYFRGYGNLLRLLLSSGRTYDTS